MAEKIRWKDVEEQISFADPAEIPDEIPEEEIVYELDLTEDE